MINRGPTLNALTPRILTGVVSTALLAGTAGCGFADILLCGSCTVSHDPRATTNAAINQWQDENDETDACRADAMQHCVAAAMLASDCGPACSIFAGDINEWLQNDGDPMDTHNNQQGSQCDAADTDAAVACCQNLLDADELRTDGHCR